MRYIQLDIPEQRHSEETLVEYLSHEGRFMIVFNPDSFPVISLKVELIVRQNARIAIHDYTNPVQATFKISTSIEDNVEETKYEEEDIESNDSG